MSPPPPPLVPPRTILSGGAAVRRPRRVPGWVVAACGLLGASTFGAARADDCSAEVRAARTAISEAQDTRDATKARNALDLLVRARRRCPDDPAISFHAGLAYAILGDVDAVNASIREAETLARQRARELNRPESEAANDSRALYLRALVHRSFGNRPGAAVELLRRIRARDPGFEPPMVAYLLFHAHIEFATQLSGGSQPDTKEADDAVKQASLAEALAVNLRDAKKRDFARHRKAQILLAANRWTEAQEILEALVAADPKHAHLRFDLASCYAMQFRWGEATTAWRETVRLLAEPGTDPRYVELLGDARMRLGVCLVMNGEVPAGLDELLAYAKTHPNDNRVWFHLGRAHVADDRRDGADDAIAALRRSYELDPSCENVVRELLRLYQTVRPDPAQAKLLTETLERDGAARKAETERRRRTRPDRTTGCD